LEGKGGKDFRGMKYKGKIEKFFKKIESVFLLNDKKNTYD